MIQVTDASASNAAESLAVLVITNCWCCSCCCRRRRRRGGCRCWCWWCWRWRWRLQQLLLLFLLLLLLLLLLLVLVLVLLLRLHSPNSLSNALLLGASARSPEKTSAKQCPCCSSKRRTLMCSSFFGSMLKLVTPEHTVLRCFLRLCKNNAIWTCLLTFS